MHKIIPNVLKRKVSIRRDLGVKIDVWASRIGILKVNIGKVLGNLFLCRYRDGLGVMVTKNRTKQNKQISIDTNLKNTNIFDDQL